MTEPTVTQPVAAPENDWWRRATRTLLQAIVAGGGLTILIDQLVHDVPPAYATYIVILGTYLGSALQNYAEQQGWVKPVLKAAPVPSKEG